MTDNKKIRVRFAPSPTGYMHVGNFRTALYGYLFAKKNKGDFILRIEDTDQKREVSDALEKLLVIMDWAQFERSEGVYLENGKIVQKGKFGPYIQSKRLDIYKKYAEELVEKGFAYYCFCTPEKLEEMRQTQLAEKKAPMYDRTCLKLSAEEVQEKITRGEKYVIRQKINTEGYTEFHDLVRGKVRIKNELLDDQILMKSDGYPTYNFANVVDDHLMLITHVTRGEEYISSTPKYIQLYKSFGWNAPETAHLPLLLNPDKSKLSKRQGDVAVEDYIKKGYLREAIINFVVLLGWNPGKGSTQEIFSLSELENIFDFSHVHKAGAVFDLKKLDWLNNQYIKKLSVDDLYVQVLPFLEKKEWFKSYSIKHESCSKETLDVYLKKVLTVEQERLTTLAEVGENSQFFFGDISYDAVMLKWKEMSKDDIKKSLEISSNVLKEIDEAEWELKKIEEALLTIAEENFKTVDGKIDRGALLWPLRVALTGAQKSPSPFEVAWVLSKKESLKRIDDAISVL